MFGGNYRKSGHATASDHPHYYRCQTAAAQDDERGDAEIEKHSGGLWRPRRGIGSRTDRPPVARGNCGPNSAGDADQSGQRREPGFSTRYESAVANTAAPAVASTRPPAKYRPAKTPARTQRLPTRRRRRGPSGIRGPLPGISFAGCCEPAELRSRVSLRFGSSVVVSPAASSIRISGVQDDIT